MDPDKLQRLRKNHSYLKQNLQPLPLLDRLYENKVLHDDDMEHIRLLSPTSEQSHRLLESLKRSGNKGYEIFCEALGHLQPHILHTLESTVLDKDIQGEQSDVHTFFDPSEDFELKGLIDQLTLDNKISDAQLERMKNYVADENGCPEGVLDTKTTPMTFLRHLMKTRLLSRYNLAFLQSLLWKVGNKALCLEVAAFARKCRHRPVYFYSPKEKAENGYAFCKFHVSGDADNFKGITIEDIVLRVSRYLGVPVSYVIPVGLEPSESIFLTLMIRQEVIPLLESAEDYTWLTDLGVDFILIDDREIKIRGVSPSDQMTQVYQLETQLRRQLESERHLKQILYDEQIANETLKDMQAQHDEQLKRKDKTIEELNTWYGKIFAVLLIAMHFIAQLVKERRGVSGTDHLKRSEAHARYKTALTKAQASSSSHSSLQELVKTTRELETVKARDQISNLKQLYNSSISAYNDILQDNIADRITLRDLGGEPTLEDIRQFKLTFELLFGLHMLGPVLQSIVRSIADKLTEKEREKLYQTYGIPREMMTPNLRNMMFEYIIFSEFEKSGNEDIKEIMKTALLAANRGDLWKEFQSRNGERIREGEERITDMTRQQSDITERLDRMEKMMEAFKRQNFMANLGAKGRGHNGLEADTFGNGACRDELRSVFRFANPPMFPVP